MENPNILDQGVRIVILNQITSDENISRKRYEQRKFDVYRNRQAKYVLERLADEFSPETVRRMRKVLSINPCKRIIDQLGSIYQQEPDRHFSGTTGEDQEQAIEDFYEYCGVNPQMRLANRFYKLCDQSALYIVPKDGKICPRALTPMNYDVIPDASDPEKAFAYIVNVFDENLYGTHETNSKENKNEYYRQSNNASPISNDSDRKKLLQRFVWWSDEMHFTTDGKGNFVDVEPIPNPIGRMPFVDIASEKDFQFFVKRGNSAVEFVIDLLVQLCDLAEVSRLQGYSQAIIYSTEQPKDLVIGPNKVIWIKQPADGQASQPKFAFESPSPDLKSSLEIINTQLKMFLTSMGLDSSVVSGDAPTKAFTSGIDHLLANIDKFQASQEDFDLFRKVENETFDIMRAWSNEYQGVTDETALDPECKIGQLSEDIKLEVKFAEPSIIETKKDKEDSVIKRWDNNLVTTKDALIELYGFDDDKADEYLIELEQDVANNPRPAFPGINSASLEKPQKGAVGPDGKPLPTGPDGKPANGGNAPPAGDVKPNPQTANYDQKAND